MVPGIWGRHVKRRVVHRIVVLDFGRRNGYSAGCGRKSKVNWS